MLPTHLRPFKIILLFACMVWVLLLTNQFMNTAWSDMVSLLHFLAIVWWVLWMRLIASDHKTSHETKPYAKIISVVLTVLAIWWIISFWFSSATAIFFVYLLCLYILRWFDARYFALLALLLLRYVPWFLLREMEVQAEQWSIYVYYALVASVVASLFQKYQGETDSWVDMAS